MVTSQIDTCITDSEDSAGKEMCGRYRESHAKEPRRQRRSLRSLQERFINDNELCSVPDDHSNSSNLT